MSEIETGGPAFPATSWTKDGNFIGENQGMALRDYFAAKAMQTLLGLPELLPDDTVASQSYEMADAMLEARKS